MAYSILDLKRATFFAWGIERMQTTVFVIGALVACKKGPFDLQNLINVMPIGNYSRRSSSRVNDQL